MCASFPFYSASAVTRLTFRVSAQNGDALSKIYVGTGAINTSFTRTGKKSLAGLLSDASKRFVLLPASMGSSQEVSYSHSAERNSVNRVFQQQLFDSGKQKAIDALLVRRFLPTCAPIVCSDLCTTIRGDDSHNAPFPQGNLATSRRVRIYNPIHESLRSQLRDREHEFTTYDTETIWVGTYNLNGRPPSDESLLPWLFPTAGERDPSDCPTWPGEVTDAQYSPTGPDPSLLVLGFQEIVPLSPQQIMATDPEKKYAGST